MDETLKNAFADAAKAHDRTAARLMRDHVAGQPESVAQDAWFRHQVQIGLESANSGRVVPDDEVEAEAGAWRDETRHRIAGRV